MSKKSLGVSCAVAAVLGSLCAGTALAGSLPTPKIGGKLYLDMTNIDWTNDGVKQSKSGTGFDVKRFYLSASEKFDSTWSAKIETDATYNKGQQTDVYIKNAYLKATLSKAFWVQVGDANLPWVPFVEDIYGYRYVEHVLVDRLHIGTSADWGLAVGGKAGGIGAGALSYQLSAVNGNGYKNPTRSKNLDIAGRVDYQLDGLTFAVGAYSGKLGKDVYGSTTYHTATRFDALAAYVGNGVRLGLDYFSANDWPTTQSNPLTSNVKDKADGYSFWASYDFTRSFGVFGRFDEAKTNKDTYSSLKDQYFDAGLVWHARSHVDVAFAYKHEKVSGGGMIHTAYGNVGGAVEGKVNEVGFWGQVSF